MIYPNKVINYKDSILGKMFYLLDNLDEHGININELYRLTSEYYDEIIEFVYSLEVLYILDYINYDEEGLIYVKTN